MTKPALLKALRVFFVLQFKPLYKPNSDALRFRNLNATREMVPSVFDMKMMLFGLLFFSQSVLAYGVTPATPAARAESAFVFLLVGVAVATYLFGWRGFLLSLGALLALLQLVKHFPFVAMLLLLGVFLWIAFKIAGSDSKKK